MGVQVKTGHFAFPPGSGPPLRFGFAPGGRPYIRGTALAKSADGTGLRTGERRTAGDGEIVGSLVG